MATCTEVRKVKQTACTDMASLLLEKLERMQCALDLIEGTNSAKCPDEDAGPGSLPLLELQLSMANAGAISILDRLYWLADRI